MHTQPTMFAPYICYACTAFNIFLSNLYLTQIRPCPLVLVTYRADLVVTHWEEWLHSLQQGMCKWKNIKHTHIMCTMTHLSPTILQTTYVYVHMHKPLLGVTLTLALYTDWVGGEKWPGIYCLRTSKNKQTWLYGVSCTISSTNC